MTAFPSTGSTAPVVHHVGHPQPSAVFAHQCHPRPAGLHHKGLGKGLVSPTSRTEWSEAQRQGARGCSNQYPHLPSALQGLPVLLLTTLHQLASPVHPSPSVLSGTSDICQQPQEPGARGLGMQSLI